MATRVQGSGVKTTRGDSSAALASHAFASTTAGNTLIARIGCHKLGHGAGDLLSGISDNDGNTWVLVEKITDVDPGTSHNTSAYIYAAYNINGGPVTISLDFAVEDDLTYFAWDVDEWSGMATSAAADKTAEAAYTSGGSLGCGPTATLAQAAQTAIGMICGPYPYAWNDVGGSGSPPSGWTLINGNTTQVVGGVLPFQSVYRSVSATTGVSVSWNAPDLGDSVCLLATFKDATATALVVEVDVDDDVATDAPTEMYVHAGGRPDQVLATRYTGSSISVVGSAGSRKIRLTPAPAGTTASQSVTVSGFGSTHDMGYYTGTVVAAS